MFSLSRVLTRGLHHEAAEGAKGRGFTNQPFDCHRDIQGDLVFDGALLPVSFFAVSPRGNSSSVVASRLSVVLCQNSAVRIYCCVEVL